MTRRTGFPKKSPVQRTPVPEPSREAEEVTARRIAENEAKVRAVNEEIEATAQRVAPDALLIPFVCECGRPECLAILRLSRNAYEEARTDARWFICSPGHELTEHGYERVIQKRDGFVIVEKQGDAARAAEQLDPRSHVQ